MSDFGAVPTEILSAVGGAITLGGSRDGFISYTKIPPGEFPFAMIYNPVKEIERRPHQHGEERTSNPLVVVWANTAIADVNTAIALIEAALDGSTLGAAAVEDTWVAAVGRDEGLESPYTAAVFQIDTKGSV